jgi:hypothetical protein
MTKIVPRKKKNFENPAEPDIVAHVCNPGTQETEAGEFIVPGLDNTVKLMLA